MSSFEKTVKLACKPKAAPPKAKYIDPIIAATYSEDGAVHDVCKALSPRLREPNSIVVFKALIVLHTMIRNGATDNVLSYLATEDVLRLKGVSAGHWAGYDTPRNLQNYALYLDTRIRTYKDLKHDPVRVQSDSNRDARVESTIQERGAAHRASNVPQRSKTIMGRKLRSMTVEKGLLRETKAVQKAITALVECRFYFDNLEDELNVTALRMLVKDLLILFQALNEGVINVLEHYFEMSHVDAETALNIYRNFCNQTEKVVEYLGVARKLQNLLNVPVPNLKHAPVSLVAALEEYLNDPNFEQNRIEYKTTRALADKNARDGNKGPNGTDQAKASSSNAAPAPKSTNEEIGTSSKPPASENKALVDFFSSIEEEHTVMFASQPNNQLLQQQQQQQQMQMQQAAHNPFAMRQSMMLTGAPAPGQVVPQSTGFIQPQQTAFPFQQSQPTGATQSQHPSFTSFLHPQGPQVPQPTGFLRPQATGANPFRQSMLMPQTTGMPAFGLGGPAGMNGHSIQANGTPFFAAQQPTGQPFNTQGGSIGIMPMSNAFSSPGAGRTEGARELPKRPASTPLTNVPNAFDSAKPIVSHQTGSRNPFGVPQQPAPPVPKAPTLLELATGAFNQGSATGGQQPTQPASVQNSPMPQASQPSSSAATKMSDVASSFSFNKNWSTGSSKSGTDTTGTPSLASQFTATSAFSSQPTGTTNGTSAFTSSPPLKPQTTGFSGLKPFKPTSSFGASLMESLPPITQSRPTTPSAGGTGTVQPTGSGFSAETSGLSSSPSQSSSPPSNMPSFGAFGSSATSNQASTAPSSFGGLSSPTTGLNSSSGLGALNAQPTGYGGSNFTSTVGVGLRPQTTGSGVANPFRASMFSTSTGAPNGSMPPLPASQFMSNFGSNSMNTPSFGSSLFQNPSGDASKQQKGVTSLI